MGGNGSGRFSSTSKAWDVFEFADALLRYLDRSLYDEDSKITAEWIIEQRAKFETLNKQFKAALERER